MLNAIFTIGHSSHSWDRFHTLIAKPDIGCVIDVRSAPHSRWAHFRKHELRCRLNHAGISYVWLGNELGGDRATKPVDYEVMAQTAAFAEGIGHVLDIAARCTPVLLCAEHEPLNCHRCLLVARHLAGKSGTEVAHILRDGVIELHRETERRLLAMHRVRRDLFRSEAQQLAAAYRLQARRIGASR